jgi:hypothetical protein
MGLEVASVDTNVRCDASCVKCMGQAVLVARVGDSTSVVLCIQCAKNLFSALGFMICSKTGDSIERLVGLKKRRTDKAE